MSETIILPAELTREMWAAAGDAVVDLQARGVGNHDKITEAVWLAIRSFAAPQNADKARLDWLEFQCVEVRTPLVYGSRENFRTHPDDSYEGEEGPSDIRAKIDAALSEVAA